MQISNKINEVETRKNSKKLRKVIKKFENVQEKYNRKVFSCLNNFEINIFILGLQKKIYIRHLRNFLLFNHKINIKYC